MKKISMLYLSFLFSAFLFAQKQINDPNAQTREAKSFHAIKVANGIELFLTQSNSETIVVSADEVEHRDRIKTEVDNGVLKIYYDNNFLKQLNGRNKKLRAYVSFINIDGVDASSGASVKVEGVIKATKLNLEASSGAIFKGNVETGTMDVAQSSGSVITISGKVTSLKIDGSSGSIFKGYELAVENCTAETSSGSGVQITVNKELSAEASSGGYVYYKGEGVIRSVRTGSGGSVSKR